MTTFNPDPRVRDLEPDTTGLGPNFPSSLNDLWRMAFRASDEYLRYVKLAVSNDNGTLVGQNVEKAVEAFQAAALAELVAMNARLKTVLLMESPTIEALLQILQEPIRYAAGVRIRCAAAGDYTAGDVLSASATNTTGRATYVPNLARTPGGVADFAAIRGRCSEDAVLLAPRFHWFRSEPAVADVEMDDNAPFDLVTAVGRDLHAGTFLGDSFVDRGTSGSTSDSVGLVEPIHCAPGETGLWLVLVTETAETNETAGMTIDFDFYTY